MRWLLVFWVFVYTCDGLSPGTHRESVVYRGKGCNLATHELNGTCFFGDKRPGTHCRVQDTACSVGQRVASHLTISAENGECKVFTWYWKCAHEIRVQCGALWCDLHSTCLGNVTCVCPNTMRGDPVLQSCVCELNHFFDGHQCQPVPPCQSVVSSNETSSTLTTRSWDYWVLVGCFSLVMLVMLILCILSRRPRRPGRVKPDVEQVTECPMYRGLACTQPGQPVYAEIVRSNEITSLGGSVDVIRNPLYGARTQAWGSSTTSHLYDHLQHNSPV